MQVVGVGSVNRDVGSMLAKCSYIQSSAFPLIPKYAGTVCAGRAKSFHSGNLSQYRFSRQMREWQEVRVIMENVSEHYPLGLPLQTAWMSGTLWHLGLLGKGLLHPEEDLCKC